MSTRAAVSVGWLLFHTQHNQRIQSERSARFLSQRLARIDEQLGAASLSVKTKQSLESKRHLLEADLLKYKSSHLTTKQVIRSNLKPNTNVELTDKQHRAVELTPLANEASTAVSSAPLVQESTTAVALDSDTTTTTQSNNTNDTDDTDDTEEARDTLLTTQITNITKSRKARRGDTAHRLHTKTKARRWKDSRRGQQLSVHDALRIDKRERKSHHKQKQRITHAQQKAVNIVPLPTGVHRTQRDSDLLRAAQLRGFEDILAKDEKDVFSRLTQQRASDLANRTRRRFISTNPQIKHTQQEQEAREAAAVLQAESKKKRRQEEAAIKATNDKEQKETQAAANTLALLNDEWSSRRKELNSEWVTLTNLVKRNIEKLEGVALYTYPDIARESVATEIRRLGVIDEKDVDPDDLEFELVMAEDAEFDAFKQQIFRIAYNNLASFDESATKAVSQVAFRPRDTYNERYEQLLVELDEEHNSLLEDAKIMIPREISKGAATVRGNARLDFMRRLTSKRRSSSTVNRKAKQTIPAVLRRFGTSNTSGLNVFLSGEKPDEKAMAARIARENEIRAAIAHS